MKLFEVKEYLTQLQAKSLNTQYKRELNKIIKKAIELSRDGNLTYKTLNDYLKHNQVNINFDLSLFDSYTLSDYRLDDKFKNSIVNAMGNVYKHPLTIASKIHKFSIMYKNGFDGTTLKGVEKNFYTAIKIQFDKNAKFLQKLSSNYIKKMNVITNDIVNDLSKNIIKSMDYYKDVRVIVKGKRRPLTQKEISDSIRVEFSNTPVRAERIIRTEVHAQQQLVSNAIAIENDYVYKKWVNKPNAGKGGAVRGTLKTDKANHLMLNNKKIKIMEKFKLKGGLADYPGDPNLPVQERVNCRCELIYYKK